MRRLPLARTPRLALQRLLALMGLLSLAPLALPGPALAGELAGVTMADTATVGGQSLLLNGMGLREKYTIDVYVGGLYLPSKTTSGSTAIQQDVAKRITMHFIYKEVTAEQMAETFHEGRAKLGDTTALEARFAKLDSWLTDVHKGDVVTLDYVPGAGTTLSYNGTAKGTLEGADMMRALWSIYLGSSPASKALKEGMLGL